MMSRDERVKALLQQRRQSFGLVSASGQQQGKAKEDTSSSSARDDPPPVSKHERIQQLLMQRRMAQHAPAPNVQTAMDSSDGESVEGELLSPGSSMSSMGFEVDPAHAFDNAAAGSAMRTSGKVASSTGRPGNGESGSSGSLRNRAPPADIFHGMDTIEEEGPGALQDSPIRRPQQQQQQQQQQQRSPSKACESLVQQQLDPQGYPSIPHEALPQGQSQQQQQQQQQQLQMQSSSGWQSGVGSLSQGLGSYVQEALAAPDIQNEAVSQGEGHGGWGVADNFSFGRPSASRSSPTFADYNSGQALMLQEGSSSSSSGGKRQRIETGAEGDSASVSSRAGGGARRGGGAGVPCPEGSSGSYTMSAGSGQGGSSSSAGASSGDTAVSSGGGGGTAGASASQGKKGPRAGDLRSLELRMAQAMHQITLGQGAGDGPFDISDLWAASSVQSASQSEAASVQHTLGSIAEEGGATSKPLHSPQAHSTGTTTGPSSSHARAASPTHSTSTSDVRQQLEQIQLQIRLHQQAMAAGNNGSSGSNNNNNNSEAANTISSGAPPHSWDEEGSQGEVPLHPGATSTASWEGCGELSPQLQSQSLAWGRSPSLSGLGGQGAPAALKGQQGQGFLQQGAPAALQQGPGAVRADTEAQQQGTPSGMMMAMGREAAGDEVACPGPAEHVLTQQPVGRPGSAAGRGRGQQQQQQRQRPSSSGASQGRGGGVGRGRGAGRGRGGSTASTQPTGAATTTVPRARAGQAAGWDHPPAPAAATAAGVPHGGGAASWGGLLPPQGLGQAGPGGVQSKLLGPEYDGTGPVERLPDGRMGAALKPVGTRDRVSARQGPAPATAFGRSLPKERPRSAPHVRQGSGSGSVGGASPEHTFKPVMNEMSREITDMSYPRDRETRLMMLSMPKALRMQKYEEMRKQLEEQQLQECTFQPKLSSRPPSPHRVRPSSQQVPVYDRLYQKKLAWEEKREKLLQERDMAQLEGCTFQPAINANGKQRASSTGRVPLHKRVAEVLRAKNERLSQARISFEQEEAAANFKPTVNPRSLQLVEHKRGSVEGLTPGERMYYEAMEAKQRGRAVDFDADAACTFAPAINDRSRTLLATSGELPAAFLQRQQYLAALAAEKKAVYRSLVEGGDCTFSPRLHSSSRSRRGSGSWNSEDWDDASDRLTKLAYQDVRHAQAVKEALREHHYAQFTFAPEINPRSRAIGKHHTVEELYSNEKGSRSRARASRAADERYEEECTFRPALDPHSLALANQRRQMGAPSLLDRLDHDMSVKMRNARLQEAQAQREYEELKECTFTPEVNKGPPPMPEPSVTIPGLSRYAELQELAKRKKEEQQRRQDEVWRKHPKGSTQLFTVPKPFHLETDQREQRPTCYSAANQEASSASSQSHSKVNSRKNQEALKALSIQRILQQNEALSCDYEN